MPLAIKSPQGIIGFVPPAALERKSGLLAIEVDVLLADRKRVAVSVPTRLEEIERRLRASDGKGIAGIREWISDRAQTRLILSDPDTASRILSADAIYWVCGKQREPFIR